MFPLLLFQDMVEACSFQPILGQILKAFVQWMVWYSFHLFSVCEKLSVPSRVKSLFLVREVLVGLLCACVSCNHYVLAKGCYWLRGGPSVLYL